MTDAVKDAPTRPAPPQPKQVWVTPELATEWLNLNTQNRSLREARAAAFARDMENGDWDERVVAGLHFVTENGLLGDGQHRLRAVEISGLPQWFYVQEVNARAVASAVDRNVKRGALDSAHFAGIKGANPVQLAIARKLLQIRAGFAPGSGGTYRPTDAEILDVLTGPDGDLVREADRVASLVRREGDVNARASVIGLAFIQASKIDTRGAHEFFVTHLAHGEGLIRQSPASALRRRLKSAPKGSMTDTLQFNYIVHAWNHYREGNILERLVAPQSWGPNGYAIAI